jgi:flagellar hook assembly protein FlgD
VLAVNANGDVIYVPGGSTTLGGICGTGANPLTGDWEIPLNNQNFIFGGQGGAFVNSVGIGTTCMPQAKLHVDKQFVTASQVPNATGIRVDNSDIAQPGTNLGFSFGVTSFVTGQNRFNFALFGNATGARQNIGVRGVALDPQALTNWGGQFAGTNASGTNFGIICNANGPSSSFNNFGVYASAGGGGTNYAGFFQANSNAGFNYGIWAEALPANNAQGPNFAGYFNGDVLRTGTDNFTSDQSLKTNIDTIANSLGIIAQLQPKMFEFNTALYPQIGLPQGTQYGLIAQNVEIILPELVKDAVHPAQYDSAGNVITPSVTYKTLNYNAFIAILIDGMKKQQEIIGQQQITIQNQNARMDSIINALAALSNQVNGCCSNASARTQQTTNISEIELGGDVVVLEQNVPNPFADETSINYFIPETAGKAQILFYNSAGQIVKTFDVQQKGKGQLRVFASNLATGMYSYTLIVDGKAIDTKRMIKN